MTPKSLNQRFPLRKLNKKSTFKKQQLGKIKPRKAGRGQKGISRRNG